MVEALADKADLRMLARKVSHDQFETACDDLSKGLEHALGKLNVQVTITQQSIYKYEELKKLKRKQLNKSFQTIRKHYGNKRWTTSSERLRRNWTRWSCLRWRSSSITNWSSYKKTWNKWQHCDAKLRLRAPRRDYWGDLKEIQKGFCWTTLNMYINCNFLFSEMWTAYHVTRRLWCIWKRPLHFHLNHCQPLCLWNHTSVMN